MSVSTDIKVLQEFEVYSRGLQRASRMFQGVPKGYRGVLMDLVGFLEYFMAHQELSTGFRVFHGCSRNFRGVPGYFQ